MMHGLTNVSLTTFSLFCPCSSVLVIFFVLLDFVLINGLNMWIGYIKVIVDSTLQWGPCPWWKEEVFDLFSI